MDAKGRLRARLLRAREARQASDRDAAASGIARQVLAGWPDVRTVAAYLAMATEPPTDRLVDELVARDVRVLLPVVAGDVLDWVLLEQAGELARGPLGVLQPTGDRLGPAAVTTADLVVAPALAVDRAGHRLGRGRGYYDRALADVPVDRVVALVFDDEVLDDVPAEPHDRSVGWAVTPHGRHRLAP